MAEPIYGRILLKLSGEALMGDSEFGIAPNVLARMAKEIAELIRMNVQVGLVIGGGNLFRGRSLSEAGLSRVTGDHMGMLATLMNALAMRDILEQNKVATAVMSAIPMSGIFDAFDRRKAINLLNEGRVVIFAGGTGNPLVTTDSAASLRSIEVEADILLKATDVDGIYDCDPAKNADAKLYHRLSYADVLDKELGVMDLSAFCQCRDHNMSIRVFNVTRVGAIVDIVTGKDEGTLVN